MSNRVLFVDDEQNVLAAIKRTVRQLVDAVTCDDPLLALELLQHDGPFAVIVSDMRMPGLSGIDFLAKAREIAPDSVRVMLTGNSDQTTAIDAVNKGEIFRFLTKPTDPETLRAVLAAGLRQHQLVTSERELLQHTLNGSIKVLAEMLTIAKPEAFGRTDRLRSKVTQIASHLGMQGQWELETAVSLSLLGCVGLPSQLLEKAAGGAALSAKEQLEYRAHPQLAADLINAIPRMKVVADIVLYQNKDFDGSGFPSDDRRGDDLPLGARVLRVALAYDDLKVQGWSDTAICVELRRQTGCFDPCVLEALESCNETGSPDVLRLTPEELTDGMTIEEDVKTTRDVLLICRGQVVTRAVRQHLLRFVDAGALADSVLVSVPNGRRARSVA